MSHTLGKTVEDVEFDSARLRGMPARFEAQKIAFGPVVFQCARVAWKSGLLAQIMQTDQAGATVEQLAAESNLSAYAISVLLETLLSAGAVRRKGGRYSLTRIGVNILHDELTQINIDYIHDVCYQGLFLLDASLRDEKPRGLRALGHWDSIYEGLSELPEPARSSWFSFDHYYSNSAFDHALKHVFKRKPHRLMDIGANTGILALLCLRHDPQLHVTLLDLPIQLVQAHAALEGAGLLGRASLHPIDMLDYSASFPDGMDAVWMSQFLTCFSIVAIGHIFRRAADCLAPGGSVWVLDTFWDRQKYAIGTYCLMNTSPYFTAIASGNSKMYESSVIVACAQANGLHLAELVDGLGICHSLLRFEKSH